MNRDYNQSMNNYYRTTNSERINRENRHVHNRPRSNSDVNSIIRILVAFVIIVASIAVIVVVINRIKDIVKRIIRRIF